jgi:hypothetical protein
LGNHTWSFLDVDFAIQHPAYGQYIVQGEGIGTITRTMTQARTQHDTAADGEIMVSKIPGNNGNLVLAIQQVAGLNKWLTGLSNYINDQQTEAKEFARATVDIRIRSTGEKISATGVSLEKIADQALQAQGQMRSWTLMCKNISNTNAALPAFGV